MEITRDGKRTLYVEMDHQENEENQRTKEEKPTEEAREEKKTQNGQIVGCEGKKATKSGKTKYSLRKSRGPLPLPLNILSSGPILQKMEE
jgi:hypothetical protein